VASHYASRLTVQTLAQEAGLSESHFAHVFHQDTGLSVRRVLRRIRVEIAKEMLAERQASLREIARSAGFVDGSHLSRAFHAETGLSLRGFRLAVKRVG
jgi:AraC family transcriptional regulator